MSANLLSTSQTSPEIISIDIDPENDPEVELVLDFEAQAQYKEWLAYILDEDPAHPVPAFLESAPKSNNREKEVKVNPKDAKGSDNRAIDKDCSAAKTSSLPQRASLLHPIHVNIPLPDPYPYMMAVDSPSPNSNFLTFDMQDAPGSTSYITTTFHFGYITPPPNNMRYNGPTPFIDIRIPAAIVDKLVKTSRHNDITWKKLQCQFVHFLSGGPVADRNGVPTSWKVVINARDGKSEMHRYVFKGIEDKSGAKKQTMGNVCTIDSFLLPKPLRDLWDFHGPPSSDRVTMSINLSD
ncbi:hypothetical protein BDN70DRAFT_900075 [Pholiota conissans]|uniref:Uncharacterized protein n=1 Tax=Pholiota conissans TaxID=109636 RepID=A0A9P6CUD3_9AGAR|nr:hypothetical protein BDN70DRAFT_900075 [Pholiota conissans]